MFKIALPHPLTREINESMQIDAAEILKSELGRRCARNQGYSLRAFARALGVSPAGLSLIINRKRPASRKMVHRILQQIELRPLERESLMRSQIGDSEPQPVEDTVSLETIERVCDWISYGILSLMQTNDFRSDTRWIAGRLAISQHQARLALEALDETGMIDRKRKPWCQTGGGIRINNQITTAITRAFHRGVNEKAMQAMEDLAPELRDISSITFAMSPSNMKQAKEEIRRFRLRMSELYEERGVSTEVYNLTLQLVPITRRP